ERYRCSPPQKRLNLAYAPGEGEYFTIRPLATYRRAPFVLRQTAPRLIVGPRRGADYFRNSLLALFEPEPPLRIEAIVAVLNSRLLDYLYRGTVTETRQQAFPQVKVRSVRQLPVWLPDPR